MREIIKKLEERIDLDNQIMTDAVNQIMSGEVEDPMIEDFLIKLNAKGITENEISSAAQVMRSKSLSIDLGNEAHVDTCGTGGTGLNIFNCSTAASFVAAAGGAQITKHGNKGVSSKSGSADLLMIAGANINHDRNHLEDILNEVSALADQGVREIHFLGQNVNNFKGTFRGEKSSLARLIELTGKVENIKRIRFTTSHPHEFKDDLVDVYGKVPELVSHVHLPVQSGSDRILKLMRRRYSAEKYMNLVERILDVRPDMRFSSDFIVGFPGETDHDFEQTMNLINQVKFDESFSFIYSPRPNTPAAEMQDEIDHDIKKERLNILQNRLSQLAFDYSRKMVGTNQECLVMGVSKRDPGQLQARTICNKVVNFSSTDTSLIKQITNIHIVDALPNCLRGALQN